MVKVKKIHVIWRNFCHCNLGIYWYTNLIFCIFFMWNNTFLPVYLSTLLIQISYPIFNVKVCSNEECTSITLFWKDIFSYCFIRIDWSYHNDKKMQGRYVYNINEIVIKMHVVQQKLEVLDFTVQEPYLP